MHLDLQYNIYCPVKSAISITLRVESGQVTVGTNELQYLNSFVYILQNCFLTVIFSLVDSLSIYVYIYLFEIDKTVSSAYITVR